MVREMNCKSVWSTFELYFWNLSKARQNRIKLSYSAISSRKSRQKSHKRILLHLFSLLRSEQERIIAKWTEHIYIDHSLSLVLTMDFKPAWHICMSHVWLPSVLAIFREKIYLCISTDFNDNYSKPTCKTSQSALAGLFCTADLRHDVVAKSKTDLAKPITDSEAGCLQNSFKNTLFLIKDTRMAK